MKRGKEKGRRRKEGRDEGEKRNVKGSVIDL